MSHGQSHTNRMDRGRLGKHETAPKVARFKDPGAVRTSGAGIEVDLDELRTALSNLQGRADQFTETVAGSDSLTDHLPNGTGPIARSMGTVFQHRLGDSGGVQYALTAHLTRLGELVDNLQNTLQNYDSGEGDVVQTIATAPGPQGVQPA